MKLRILCETSWDVYWDEDESRKGFFRHHLLNYLRGDILVDPIAGTGYVGSVLRKYGVKVKMSDLNPATNPIGYHRIAAFKGIRSGNVSKLRIESGVDILLSQPDNNLPNFLPRLPSGTRVILLADKDQKWSGARLDFSGWSKVAEHRTLSFSVNPFGKDHSQILTVYDKS